MFGVVTEAFSYVALQPVARYRPAHCPAGHRQPESWMVCPVGTQDECHDLRVHPGAAGQDPFEFFPPPQPVFRPEPPIGELALRQRVCVVPSHAVR